MSKKKLIAIVVAAALVVCCAITGTLAWLTATSPKVTNTFTFGNIDITLTEDEGTITSTGSHEFKMIPGYTITKDPVVTVEADSEACWLFVKVEKSDNFDSFMTYTIASGWTELTTGSGVYYRQVAASNADQDFPVLANDTVTVRDTVTKAMMDALEDSNAVQPTLTFKAYAVQLYKSNVGSTEAEKIFTPAEAWTKVNP